MSTTTRLSIAAASAMLAMASLAVGTNVHAAEQTQKADKSDPLGRCYGINTCKGTSLCATAKNDCKGLNNCKGEGVLVKTRSACLAAGGTLTEPK
ncbi:hypothetical protein FHW83_001341 [Duganella sp. SG902]|uniref:BufA2 family periplasmic bufferin-type metallophore n=1 Tax=Duganella sp. SG902 TaxID=2587016 RepID=UPI00159EA1BA|nr:hypothetical protein [Duganella sp. SG902]NVM75554.1 hypothetical protein [Duganella sp. SG902]